MIKVFSTYTKDIIHNKDTGEEITRKGGPAFYIEKIFKKNKVKYTMNAQKAKIKINIKDGIETGILEGTLKAKEIEKIEENDIVVLSTVDNEWVLKDNFSHGAKVFLDTQGYVRSAKKTPSIFELSFWNKIYCMKTNDKEVEGLPIEILSNQKNKLLIITKGAGGVTIYSQRRKYDFRTNKIKAKDYIGAGDTFFAAFITGFIRNNLDVIQSGNFAVEEATEFLLNKK